MQVVNDFQKTCQQRLKHIQKAKDAANGCDGMVGIDALGVSESQPLKLFYMMGKINVLERVSTLGFWGLVCFFRRIFGQ